MKRLILMSMAVALFTTATAQQRSSENAEPRVKPTIEEMATKITNSISQRIILDEAQAKKIYKINLDYLKEVEKSKLLKSKRDQSILAILDDNQDVAYIGMISTHKKKVAHKPHHKGGSKAKRLPQTPPPATK